MRFYEIISELTFQGSPCTKDCSGHQAGYAWQKTRNGTGPCVSSNDSFNKGCEIAKKQIADKKVTRPKVRNPQGRFAANPQPRKPAQTTPIKPVKPV